MTNNRNGFADALNQLNTLMNVGQRVPIEVLKEAAEYFVAKLRPRINLSDKNKQTHLRNSLKIVVKNDRVSVIFEGKTWYWHLAEHGHKKAGGKGRVKGLHFVKNTIDAEKIEIEKIMLRLIVEQMEG